MHDNESLSIAIDSQEEEVFETMAIEKGAELKGCTPEETNSKVSRWIDQLRVLEQVNCPLTHHFAPGIYVREIFMPAGTIVIGKVHKTEHLNIIERGKYQIRYNDGLVATIEAPYTFVSGSGMQKVLYILQDTVWKTVHATSETDVSKLEALLVEEPPVPALSGKVG